MTDREMLHIASESLNAAINPFGAELSHLHAADGRELMTDADPAFWRGRAPLLFPIVGALNGDTYRLNGRAYRMPKHGFARRQMFELMEQAPRQLHRAAADHAGAQEDGQQLGVAEARRAAFEEFFPRAFCRGPVTNAHATSLSSRPLCRGGRCAILARPFRATGGLGRRLRP